MPWKLESALQFDLVSVDFAFKGIDAGLEGDAITVNGPFRNGNRQIVAAEKASCALDGTGESFGDYYRRNTTAYVTSRVAF